MSCTNGWTCLNEVGVTQRIHLLCIIDHETSLSHLWHISNAGAGISQNDSNLPREPRTMQYATCAWLECGIKAIEPKFSGTVL